MATSSVLAFELVPTTNPQIQKFDRVVLGA